MTNDSNKNSKPEKNQYFEPDTNPMGVVPDEQTNILPHRYGDIAPDNPWYPLPADYPELTSDGQRQARVDAVTRQNTPMEFVAAWDAFRRLYLMTTEPGFFYHNFVPSPPFHYQAVHDMGDYARNILAAPRGTAKSVVVGTEIPLFLSLTRPYFRMVVSLATDKLIEGRFDTLMTQYTNNSRIIDDFGKQKPSRGQAIWNRHHLQLLNGSKIEGFSVTGRKRGARPDLFILDDPEYDPDSETSAQVMRDKFEVFLFRQVIPMLEEGSGIFWVGTMIGARSFLYHACYGDDPRFQFWNMRVLKAAEHKSEEDGQDLLWKEKWSSDALEIRKQEIGDAAFKTEYLNTPASETDKMLRFDEKLNTYEVYDEDGKPPLESNAKLSYYKYSKPDEGWIQTEDKVGNLTKSLFRVITVDPSKGLTQHHDFSCISVLGFGSDNCLWVLDMWMGRVREGQLLREIYRLGEKWMPKVIGIESISMQIELVDAASEYLTETAGRHQSMWKPRVFPVNYKQHKGPTGKPDRIATLEWRFDSGKIKYPHHLKRKWPYNALYAQTMDFTYDMALMQHDDAIDSVAMGHYIVHSKGMRRQREQHDPTVADQIRSGKTEIEGVPIVNSIVTHKIDGETMDAVLDRSSQRRYNTPDSLGIPKPNIKNRKDRRAYERLIKQKRREKKMKGNR